MGQEANDALTIDRTYQRGSLRKPRSRSCTRKPITHNLVDEFISVF
jgi:hypothetical protein